MGKDATVDEQVQAALAWLKSHASKALLWSLAPHDRQAPDQRFQDGLRLIERAAVDERNFVKKAVAMALKAIGKRNRPLRTAAVALATRLADSDQPAARWIGQDALRDLRRSRGRTAS